MSAPTAANYVFLPWVRQGAASGIQTPDSLGKGQAGVVSVTARLRVNDTPDIERQVRLYGPGDITGLDPQQVIRTEPRHLATDFEPNYFPAIEFDRPDFPWLFTPARANDAGRLRPWICLVVVRKQEGVVLHTERNLPLPVLEITAPEHELPDLSESWAWAHAQVTGSLPESKALKRSLAGDPALTLSRLLCPRRLDPTTDYLACVVPAFELGRKAGLGLPIEPADEQKLEPAWASGAQSPTQVILPVYYHWEFRTGTGGDFETLVRSLEPRQMGEHVGKRPMDISQPGFLMRPSLPQGTTLELEGPLRVRETQTADWPSETRTPFQEALAKILNAPWQAMKDGLQEGAQEPLLAPPIYGCWQAMHNTVEVTPEPPASPPSPPWLHELNLDPRHRAVAALGTQVVQAQQEQLMAAAWEQLGEIQRIHQLQRQAQLARAVNGVYYSKHFQNFSDETLIKVLASAQRRVVVNATGSTNVDSRAMPSNLKTSSSDASLRSSDGNSRAMLSHMITQSAIPDRAVSAPLRRLTSPRGVISGRFRAADTRPVIAIVSRLNTTSPVVPFQRKAAGWVMIDQVSDRMSGEFNQTIRFEQVSNALNTRQQLVNFQIAAEGDRDTLFKAFGPIPPFPPQPIKDSQGARAFREAAIAHQDYLKEAFVPGEDRSPSLMDLATTKDALLQSINPETTIKARVDAALIVRSGTVRPTDPLEQIRDAPDFPQPMYEALRDLSQDFLFPGLEEVPPNTVTLLETNSQFVESFLVGLNAEMSHEFLWRGYPTDQRGTYFRHFWDTLNDDRADIKAITEWGKSELGQNLDTGEQLVLLIRGELLRQYPNSVIYAVKAEKSSGQLNLSSKKEDELHPLFRGTLKPDVTFLGFRLDRDDAIGDPGYFFVIQEQPTEPRFGLDAANFEEPLPSLTGPTATWNDLSWRHLAETEEKLKALSHASTKSELPVIRGVEWGRNAAHQAYITRQHPVRIAIHAKDMIHQG